MTTFQAPLRDMRFLLNEFLNLESYNNLPGFAEVSTDIVDAILEEGARFATEVLHVLNQSGDEEGCRWEEGQVTTPVGFKEAYQKFIEGGWTGLTCDPDFGGQGLPKVLGTAMNEIMCAANMAFSMYPGLSYGAYEAIHTHGSEEQKSRFLPKLVSGEWSGTMNLTEPHCGTDLGLMRTRADPRTDGTYAITGTKIFISAGEHDLTENIIHLVLAKIPGGPEGTKGLSLFIVPKFLVGNDGLIGARNKLSCGSIEDKMGIHGNATCVMNYDGATGYLLGGEHGGLQNMFTMMNFARLGVGMQGLAQSEVSYQNAAAYALDRLQGRSLTGPKYKDKPADPLIVHPDIRRMLMDQRAFNEGARALLYWTALKADILQGTEDPEEREISNGYLGLLTPVLKGYLTDKGFAHAVNAQQVYGGHGYIREWGMEQFVRDARIAMIYEGANGIQALDLVGRKLAADGGKAIQAYLGELGAYAETHKDNETLADYVAAVRTGKGYLEDALQWLMANGLSNPDNAGAASTDFLHLMGIVSLTYVWGLMAEKLHERVANGGGADPFYANKLKVGHYFLDRIFPDAAAHLQKLKSGAATMMALADEDFVSAG